MVGLALVARAEAPRNIILFIGDGMGYEHVKAGRYFAGSPLSFESFPNQGDVATGAADKAVTDSAAAATAMATGQKVNNGVISVALPGDGHELETLLEWFQQRGKRVGLVTTSSIVDATPACFAAHAVNRGMGEDIAGDYLTQTRPNVLFGGGHGRIIAEAVSNGFAMATNRIELQDLVIAAPALAAGQFAIGNMPYEDDGLGDLPHLSEMTTAALDLLDDHAEGFFLMVEGALIDKAAHANNISRNVRETVEFGSAVAVATNWASGRDDTLIIVTADHETGGLKVFRNLGPGVEPQVTWSSGGHTATNVPLYGWGAGSAGVVDVHDNTEIHGLILNLTTGSVVSVH